MSLSWIYVFKFLKRATSHEKEKYLFEIHRRKVCEDVFIFRKFAMTKMEELWFDRPLKF